MEAEQREANHYNGLMEAEFTHTGKSIERLYLSIWKSFRKKTIILFRLIGLLVILLGLKFLGKLNLLAICLVLMGVILQFIWRRLPALEAASALSSLGDIGTTRYIFNDDAFSVSGKAVPYSEIIKLCRDRQYCYLFVDHRSAYMIGRCEDGKLEAFISEKVGLGWIDLGKALSMRGKDITYERENTREKKDYLKWIEERIGNR